MKFNCVNILLTERKQIMAKSRNTWVYNPPKPSKPKVSESFKKEVKHKADELIESVLKPEHIKPPPEGAQRNYLVGIFSKWYRSYFYFCSKYNCPGPNAISPSFEEKFARMEYVGEHRFNLAYMRHTGQWWEIYQDLSLEKCLESVAHEPHFFP